MSGDKISSSMTLTTTTGGLISTIEPWNELILGEWRCEDYGFGGFTKKLQGTLPKKTIINDNAVVLIWGDDTKTIVKRHKEDNIDPIKGFLWAFFQAKCGMSKTKANKYLEKLLEEDNK